MFQTLETTWDHSARRPWTTLASFTMQALGLSLLFLIPLVSMQAPPQWALFAKTNFLSPREGPPPPSRSGSRRPIHGSELRGEHLLPPPVIPNGITQVNDANVPAAVDVYDLGIRCENCRRGPGIAQSFGDAVPIAPPSVSPSPHPLIVSHWAEGNVIYRVQPVYPLLARQARIQGSVKLSAIISKAGTIENLTVLSGHAMLMATAVEAVKQWRYRPYLLNGMPIEVETEITVNFVLSGN